MVVGVQNAKRIGISMILRSIGKRMSEKPKKCHFCGRENEDVSSLEFRGKKSLPTCPSCLKKAVLYMLDFSEFLKEIEKQ
jgi:transposase-like protein